MKFIVKCPHCDNPFSVESNWAGQITSCPICNHQVRVPEPPPGNPVNEAPRPYTTVPRAFEAEEMHGASFSGDACLAFFITLLCCMPIGVFLAFRAHSKMRENNNYSGRIWVYLSYAIAIIGIIGSLGRVVMAAYAIQDLQRQGSPGLIHNVNPEQ